MKKALSKILRPIALAVVIALLASLSACNLFGDNGKTPGDDTPSATYTLTYKAESGGSISGKATQTVKSGGDGEEVEAVADDGHSFVGWSDGSREAKRKDTNVTENLEFTAKFIGSTYSVTYTANNFYASDLKSATTRTVNSNDSTSITVTPALGYKFVEWSDGVKTPSRTDDKFSHGETITAIFAPDTLNLPVVLIDTLGNAAPTVKSSEYVECEISLTNTTKEYEFEDKAAGIRVRGNTTSRYVKKPYRIKFDKKISLFGSEYKYKSWCLLALYQDFSDIKDYTAFKISQNVNPDKFAPSANHVEVYMNGEFLGLYLLTDQVDEKEGRMGVESEFDETAVEVPFTAQIDLNITEDGVEGVDYFKLHLDKYNVDMYFDVQYPGPDERFTAAQFEYIKNYLTTVNDLIFKPNLTKAEFEEYVDLDAFVEFFLIEEVMGQAEINNKSVKMSKAVGGKLVMGPVWDFDWATGGPMRNNSGMNDTNYPYDVSRWNSDCNWWNALIGSRSETPGFDWFREAARTRWAEMAPIVESTLKEVESYKPTIKAAALRNEKLWTELHEFTYVSSSTGQTVKPVVTTSFNEYYDWVINYIRRKSATITRLLG